MLDEGQTVINGIHVAWQESKLSGYAAFGRRDRPFVPPYILDPGEVYFEFGDTRDLAIEALLKCMPDENQD